MSHVVHLLVFQIFKYLFLSIIFINFVYNTSFIYNKKFVALRIVVGEFVEELKLHLNYIYNYKKCTLIAYMGYSGIEKIKAN